MREEQKQPVLAESADLLSDRLREYLDRLAATLGPDARKLEQPFLRQLRKQGFDAARQRALLAVSLIEVLRCLSGGDPLTSFFEGAEYHGRRLAKMNVEPSSVVRVLGECNALLEARLRDRSPSEIANFQWVRDQLLFCTILSLNNAYYQVRADEARAFYELSRVELASNSLTELLPGILAVLRDTFGAAAAALYLLDREKKCWERRAAIPASIAKGEKFSPSRLTASNRKKLAQPQLLVPGRDGGSLLLDLSWRPRYQSTWSVPLLENGEAVGVFQLGFTKKYCWLPRETEFLAAAAERCWQAIEKTRILEDLATREHQLREMAERMLQVEEAERRRISRELHDEAGQSLLYIRLQLEMLEKAMAGAPRDWVDRLRQGREALEATIIEVRRLISALSPAVLEQLGLEAALRQLVSRLRRQHTMRVKLQLTGLSNLPKGHEVILYRLVQECCNNIVKHSSASNVNICLSVADGKVRLMVEDDGVGFDLQNAASRADSFGLEGLRERVKLMGGSFEIRSLPRAGSKSEKKQVRSGLQAPVSGGRIGFDKPGTAVQIEAPARALGVAG